ncbi:MAG: hypothetical protein IKB72_00800 [Ruminococcus sp.]|nr:hypothetical protein [Ruminococcus sp.]
MNKESKRCPYCSRKVNYWRRLLENSKGEHTCKNCKKISNIKQNPVIWITLILCCLFALFILIFYFSSAKSIQNTYDDTGKMKFLVKLFFGDLKEVKWILWEIFPFIVFYFISPFFIEFSPQKRFMEQTQSKIDLSVPLTNTSSNPKVKTDQRSRNILKVKEPAFSGVYEDISSSSENDMDKTKSFKVSDSSEYFKEDKKETTEVMTDINVQKNSVSNSYSSDVPLVKVSHNTPLVSADEDVKEYVPTKERAKENKPAEQEKPTQSNYSANRKF